MRVIRVMFAMAAVCVAAPASAQQSDQEKQQEITRLGAKFLSRQEIQSFGFKYKTIQVTNTWLVEVMEQLGPDRHVAWHVLGRC